MSRGSTAAGVTATSHLSASTPSKLLRAVRDRKYPSGKLKTARSSS
jgi:hypothetical protein